MFYSHEILTSQQYGVATVWLVSTIGFRSANRKISRKAIQEVNVQKACETIIKPGAPIALRLQGSLLYGVSRVYSQQCNYVLSDAEKIQSHMRAFYSVMGGSENAIDLQAGKARRDQLILQDDPEFDLGTELPALIFDDDDGVGGLGGPQFSQKTSSQLSPLQRDAFSVDGHSLIAESPQSLIVGTPQSAPGGRSSQLHSPFRLENTPHQKSDAGTMPFQDDMAHLQDFDDWGIEIDAFGNAIALPDEPELPTLPRHIIDQEAVGTRQSDTNIPSIDHQGDVVMGSDEMVLPEAKPQVPQYEPVVVEEIMDTEEVVVPARPRLPRTRPQLVPDEETAIPRKEYKTWSENYLANAERARKSRSGTTAAEAKKNAFHFIFGRGVADVGVFTGVPGFPQNPLANYFAGGNLQATMLGVLITNNEDGARPRGRRRTALEALELEEEEEEGGRRVRRRLSEGDQHLAQASTMPQSQLFNARLGEEEKELGRDAGSVLPDRMSSDVPWNRGSSQIPGSSVKGSATAERYRGQNRQVSASPLHGRGSRLPSDNIERFSDQPAFPSDGDFVPMLHSANDTFSDAIEGPGTQAQGTANTSQPMRNALDLEGRNFLGYVENVAKEKGSYEEREQDPSGGGRTWIDFDDLFEGADNNRVVAVQAFYHVLTLATKNAIRVQQECENMQPYGKIRVGVQLADEGVMEE